MKLSIVLSILCSVIVFSQEKPNYRNTIDSIQHKNWNSTNYNLDSLSITKLTKVDKKTKDTLILKTHSPIFDVKELPITPFNLNKFQLPKKWYFYGNNNLFFNQASFSSWNAGGQTNIGVLTKVEYHLDYKNYKHFLENILMLGYGWNSTKGQSSRKTEDFINFMTNYGYRIGENYYLSTGAQLITQFATGYDYNATPNPNYEDRISKFFAPAYINTGIGVLYNPNKNFQLVVRPINGKMTIINDKKLQKKGRYGLEKDGQNIRAEFGAMINVSYRLKIYKDVFFDNKLNVFTNYTSHPEQIDIFYNGILNIKFNKFITTVISLDLGYDHDQIKKLQTKQTLSVGFTYNVGSFTKPKKKKTISPFVK